MKLCKIFLLFFAFFVPTALICRAGEAQDISAATAAYYRDYSKAAAHLKFAGVLLRNGFTEAAFEAVEAARGNCSYDEFKRDFDKFTRRKLNTLLPDKANAAIAKLPPPLRPGEVKKALSSIAANNAVISAYAAFINDSEKSWNSTAHEDVKRISRALLRFAALPEVGDTVMFNSTAARYFDKIVKSPEIARNFYLKLYFNDPFFNCGEPVDYCLMRIDSQLYSDPEIKARLRSSTRSVQKLIKENLLKSPKLVTGILRVRSNSPEKAEFYELLLIALNSPSVGLRSYIYSKLARQGIPGIAKERLLQMVESSDAGQRAAGTLLLQNVTSGKHLAELLASFAVDKADLVKMSAAFAARECLSKEDLEYYQKQRALFLKQVKPE